MTRFAAATAIRSAEAAASPVSRPAEVYDGNGGYLTSFTDAIYTEALNQALQNADALCSDTQLLIQLKYMDGTWKIVTDRNLMTALIGGEN